MRAVAGDRMTVCRLLAGSRRGLDIIATQTDYLRPLPSTGRQPRRPTRLDEGAAESRPCTIIVVVAVVAIAATATRVMD